MSDKYPGGIITKTPVVPAGPYQDGAAPGIWTLEQQAYYAAQGLWPIAGNANPSSFIENLFSTYLYTGNGSTQTITNNIALSTKGGLVWLKERDVSRNNVLFDTARGATKPLYSNLAFAEGSDAQSLTSFNANGFSVGSDSSSNLNAGTYASWTFRKQAKFFDVVTYTGDGNTPRAISHNLGSVPGCIIVKRTDTTSNWNVYHRSLGADYSLLLNLTNDGTGGGKWAGTSPTSTDFYVSSDSAVNANGGTYVAYLFAHNAGGFGTSGTDNVISCGSFTTNGSGVASVNLGYEPQWVILKKTSGAENWITIDNIRGWQATNSASTGYSKKLNPNTSSAEAVADEAAITSTGFNISNVAASATYIYIAIRRGPMKTPTTGTSVFTPVATGATSTFPAFTSGFITDSIISGYKPGSVNYPLMASRLAGNNFLKTPSTGVETSWADASWQSNTGFGASSSNWTSDYTNPAMLQRAPGFHDVVCYTGTGSAHTESHNLGVVPEFIIVKKRSASGSWNCYNAALGNTSYVRLEETSAAASDGGAYWNSTTPTSSVFSLGTGLAVNESGSTLVAYLFASCPGVSKVGSYTGTGTTNQINCGFTGGARFVLIKRTDSTGDWYMWDSANGIVSGNDPYFLLNSTAGQVTNTDYVDTYSAGFEISSTAPSGINANGGSFIFLAIA